VVAVGASTFLVVDVAGVGSLANSNGY
jgi:hypothetical protein